MAIVQPERPDSAQKAGAGGQIGAPETSSDSGMGLEATLPSVPPRPLTPEPPTSLDEPSGAFATSPAPESELKSSTLPAVAPATKLDEDLNARFERVLATVRVNRPHDDLDLIRAAWAFCQEQHEGQRRASGEPYVIHPLEVAQVLADLKMDATAIAAGHAHARSLATISADSRGT